MYNYMDMGNYNEELLSLLIEAMKDERQDFVKYREMIEMTDNKEISEQIKFAYEDEGKHYKMFQKIYKDITGKQIDIPLPQAERIGRLVDAVKSSINGELEAVELYRKIRAMLRGKKYRDILFEIITDEQEHAIRFTYVYAMLK